MVEITPLPPRAVASVSAFRAQDGLSDKLRAAFGAAPPERPGFVMAGELTLACVAPGRFLISRAPGTELADRLAQARECLARVVPIDLDPAVFRVGDLALTRAGHLDVRLCRVTADEYEIWVTRSVGEDLHHALREACACG